MAFEALSNGLKIPDASTGAGGINLDDNMRKLDPVVGAHRSLTPIDLFDPEVTTINATTGIRPLKYLSDGKLYGAHPDDDEIHVSTNHGTSWTKYCDVAEGTGRIRQIGAWDAVYVDVVPEPGAVALMAIGGALILLRRKR